MKANIFTEAAANIWQNAKHILSKIRTRSIQVKLPEKLRKDAAYRLFEALEVAGFIGRDWKPTARFFWNTPTKKGQPRIWDIVYMAALFKQIGINDYADAFQTFWGLTNVAAYESREQNYLFKSENQKALDRFFENYQNVTRSKRLC